MSMRAAPEPRKYETAQLSLIIRAAAHDGYAVYDNRPESGGAMVYCGNMASCQTFIATWFGREKGKATS